MGVGRIASGYTTVLKTVINESKTDCINLIRNDFLDCVTIHRERFSTEITKINNYFA